MQKLTTRGLSSTLLLSVLPTALLLGTGASLAAQAPAIPSDLRRAADSALSLNRSAGVASAWGEPTDDARMQQVARTERAAKMLRDITRETLTTADARLLYDNLAEYGLDPREMPFVIQYNKRDLPNVASVPELEANLNPTQAPAFEAAICQPENAVGVNHRCP